MPEPQDPNNKPGASASDIGHGILDVAGLVPGFGEAADLANAAWYAGEGKYLDAGLSLISMIPIVGDLIGKGGKLAKKLGPKASRKVLEAVLKLDPKYFDTFKSNPKLAPYIDKIQEAVKQWQKDIVKTFYKADASKGVKHCAAALSKTTNNANIVPTPGKTTTILGTYVSDTRRIIEEELKVTKSVNIGANPGGFNLLNIPDHIYKPLNADEFFEQFNKPWLDEAIKRGDKIVMATDPTVLANTTRNNRVTGALEPSGFGREINYLQNKGYVYDAATKSMIKK